MGREQNGLMRDQKDGRSDYSSKFEKKNQTIMIDYL